MNNREKLNELENKEFWAKIRELIKCSTEGYIDWERWLESEDENPNHFLRKIGYADIYPTEAEVALIMKKEHLPWGDLVLRNKVKKANARIYALLGETEIYGCDYVTLADEETGQIIKMPRKSVFIRKPVY